MRALKMIVPAAVFAGLVVCSAVSYAKPAYATKEKKACTFCHGKMDSNKETMAKNLNDAGKYYASHEHSLDGYKSK